MLDFFDLRSFPDELAAFFVSFIPIFVSLLLGITALGIAWGGRRMGMLFGALGLASGLLGLGGALLIAPHLWWIAVIPIAIGAATVRAWHRHAGTVTARRLQFGLRGLTVLVLIIGLILGGIVSQYRQSRIEEAAAATLEAMSASGSNHIRWSFGRVTQVILYRSPDPVDFDKAADALEQFSQLRVFQINDPLPGRVTQRLGRLTTLRSLCAQGTAVTDDDLRALVTLRNLEYLELDGRQLTDAGLDHLGRLKRLRTLNLYNANQVTAPAMVKLRAQLPKLDKP